MEKEEDSPINPVLDKFQDWYWHGLVWGDTGKVQTFEVRPGPKVSGMLEFAKSLTGHEFRVTQDKKGIHFEFGKQEKYEWIYNQEADKWSREAQVEKEGNERQTGSLRRKLRSTWRRGYSSKAGRIRRKRSNRHS